jgi:SpoVK/Ycf46/Vps4 family AAA+-type ATPase
MNPARIRLSFMIKSAEVKRLFRREIPKELLTLRQKQKEKLQKIIKDAESQKFFPLPMKSLKDKKVVNLSLERAKKNVSLPENKPKVTFEDRLHITEDIFPLLEKRIKILREIGLSWDTIKTTLCREYTQQLRGFVDSAW